MKTRLVAGLILLIIGAAMLIGTIPIHYYISDVLLPPTEPPTMKPLEGIDRLLIEISHYFSFMNVISMVIIPIGIILILISRRKRK